MGNPPSLDSLGEIYPGFVAHRTQLKRWRPRDADYVWRRAFALVRLDKAFYQCSDRAVARETMRILLAARPPARRSGGKP